MDTRQLRTLIIVPAFNEEKNIAKVVDEIQNYDPKLDVVVIDDGSSDQTRSAALQAGATVISLPFNLGIGGAMQTGFMYARNNGYDIAIQVDGDGQHLPAEISKLVHGLTVDGHDVVIGSRYLEHNDYQTPAMRRLGMLVFSFINSRIAKKRVTDNTSGFRAYNQRAIEFLAHSYPADYPEVETVAVLAMHKFDIHEVPVAMRARQFGVSSIDSLGAIYYMIKVSLALLVNISRRNERLSETA